MTRRVRDFDDPAEEDYERILDERDRAERFGDRYAEQGPLPMAHHLEVLADLMTRPAPQED
jgi:hypothetical protein